MHFLASVALIQTLSLFAPTAVAEELNADDVPTACSTICQPMVQLTNTCDVDPNESAERKLRLRADTDGDADGNSAEADEAVEAQCICSNKSFNVASVAALCASCIAQNGKTTDDMDTIMSQCSFSSTTYAASTTSAVAGITVVATKPTVAAELTASGSGQATQTSTAKNAASAAYSSGVVGSVAAAMGITCMALLAL